MPFHVEISSPVNRARALNLDRTEVGREVLEPWVAGLRFEFGESQWEPRESRLTILEGPTLTGGDRDECWESALRAANDVTRSLLEAAEESAPTQTAVVIEGDSVDAALREPRVGRAPQQIPWSAAVERIGNRDPEVTAVILVVRPSDLSWPEF
jgi:hypothetical protein